MIRLNRRHGDDQRPNRSHAETERLTSPPPMDPDVEERAPRSLSPVR
jgi:hypothetical protein